MLQHENGKKSGRGSENQTPPLEKKSVSGTGGVAYDGREPKLSTNLVSVYLPMDWWAIELVNRVSTGFIVGVEFYSRDVEEEEPGELRFHLGLLSINFLWL